MPLILHISDFHLVGRKSSPALGVHKVKLVPVDDQVTHYELLRRTLAGMAQRLVAEGRTLDAIIFTGEAADKNHPQGYQAFLELLQELGHTCPEPSRIVVVPGNHDVVSGLRPGNPNRYTEFVKALRGAGFVTPRLDGVDTNPVRSEDISRHIAQFQNIEIVPINTSAYAQVKLDLGLSEQDWEKVLEAAESAAGLDARHALEKVALADAARISEGHLDDIHKMLTGLSRSAPTGGKQSNASPVRIAVLHHQLLPVSTDEEVKSFESLTNLGLVRQFLRDNDFAIVLHGHKHSPHWYQDYVISYDKAGAHEPRPITVIAGPSPSPGSIDQSDICRLLDINTEAGTIEMEIVPALQAGGSAKKGKVETLSFDPPGAATVATTQGVTVVDGNSITTVYARLIATLARAGDVEVSNVVCHIRTAPKDAEIAALYPGFAGSDADDPKPVIRLEQFQELVRWWQDPTLTIFGDDQPFTHGNRILQYDGYLNQLEDVARAILAKPETSRAVVLLLHPPADQIGTPSQPFPSFCLVQFRARQLTGSEPPVLDCVAYFRKQEVKYWWLVNVAELTFLQRRLAELVGQRAKGDQNWLTNLEPGTITSIAARAHAGRTPPKVQVPRIDQYYKVSRERLVDMAHAVVWEQMPDREALAREWLRTMSDLIPAPERDPDGVPVPLTGLAYLADQVSAHLPGRPAEEAGVLTELVKALRALKKENDIYDSDQKLERATKQRHAKWRVEVSTLVKRILELTYSRIVTSGLPKGDRPGAASGVGTTGRGRTGSANMKSSGRKLKRVVQTGARARSRAEKGRVKTKKGKGKHRD